MTGPKTLLKPNKKIPNVRSGLSIKTIPELLVYGAENYSDNTAYLRREADTIREYSFGDVLSYVRSLAAHLIDLGYKRGDHIAVLSENRPEWCIAYFAVTWIGAVVITLDARSQADSVENILLVSDSIAVITSASHLKSIESAKDRLPGLKDIISMEDFDDICKLNADGVDMAQVLPEDLLQILFTSGTTGDPKGVMLTHRNVVSNVGDMYCAFDFTPEDRAFSILPIHHSYECTCGFLTTFTCGLSVFFARSVLKPREMLEDLKSASPTIWLNTPLILEKLYLRIEKQLSSQKGLMGYILKILPNSYIGKKAKEELGLADLKLIMCGGAALPDWVSEGLAKYGFPIIQGYGLSESSPVISFNPPSRAKNQSVGLVIQGDEVEIRDPDHNGIGEIAVRGPNIMKGYYKNETATREILDQEGWLLTGDLGYFDTDSYLYITGRKKSLIVTRGGKNIYPEEIEEKLVASNLIEEALVFSPDDESIEALIFPNMEEVTSAIGQGGTEPDPEAMWEHIEPEVRRINKLLEPYKRVRRFALRLEEFPKTTTRKIKRFMFKGVKIDKDTKVL